MVFVLCADADKADLKSLHKHLFLAEKNKVLRLNYPGREKTDVGLEHATLLRGMDEASIILLLISSDLFFDHDDLVERALARSKAGARVVPVLLSDYNLEDSKLKDLVALPREKGPVSRWKDADSAWKHIAEHVRALAVALKAK